MTGPSEGPATTSREDATKKVLVDLVALSRQVCQSRQGIAGLAGSPAGREKLSEMQTLLSEWLPLLRESVRHLSAAEGVINNTLKKRWRLRA